MHFYIFVCKSFASTFERDGLEGTIENINTKIIKDYKLDRPVIGLDQARIDAQKRKREVRKRKWY